MDRLGPNVVHMYTICRWIWKWTQVETNWPHETPTGALLVDTRLSSGSVRGETGEVVLNNFNKKKMH